MTWWSFPGCKLTVTGELVLETHIERGVGGRSERLADLTHDVPGTTVVIAHGIFDLEKAKRKKLAIACICLGYYHCGN